MIVAAHRWPEPPLLTIPPPPTPNPPFVCQAYNPPPPPPHPGAGFCATSLMGDLGAGAPRSPEQGADSALWAAEHGWDAGVDPGSGLFRDGKPVAWYGS